MPTPDQFVLTANQDFADNTYQKIRPSTFRKFAAAIRDTFVAQAAVNVPDYEEGRYYAAGFIIRHSFGGGTPVFLEAATEGYLPAPTAAAGDEHWRAALSPAGGPGLSQVGNVAAMRHSQNFWVPGRLYILVSRTDPGTGDALPDVYVRALSESQLEPEGFIIDESSLSPVSVRVRYELATDTTAPVAGAGYSKEQVDELLADKAPVLSPYFQGSPQAPTPGTADTSELLATTRFVHNVLALSYTNAYPFVCVRASGVLNFTLTTIDAAIAWTSEGGPGSVAYVNRPCALGNIAVLKAGVILDLQHNQLDLSGSVIRLGNGAEIRNNRLMYSGRLAPDYGDGTPCSFTVRGGTLAGRINYLINNEATCILDGVAVTDFGQQQLGGLNVGLATSDQVGPKVVLRNGAYFSTGYPPHPNTVVTVEAAPVYALVDTYATLAYTASLVLDFATADAQLLHLGGNLAITATAHRAQGRNVQLELHNAASSDVSLSWPAGWSWRNPVPASLAAGKQATLSLVCRWGSAESDIVAAYAAQP